MQIYSNLKVGPFLFMRSPNSA